MKKVTWKTRFLHALDIIAMGIILAISVGLLVGFVCACYLEPKLIPVLSMVPAFLATLYYLDYRKVL